jgi:hypothetical protein
MRTVEDALAVERGHRRLHVHLVLHLVPDCLASLSGEGPRYAVFSVDM